MILSIEFKRSYCFLEKMILYDWIQVMNKSIIKIWWNEHKFSLCKTNLEAQKYRKSSYWTWICTSKCLMWCNIYCQVWPYYKPPQLCSSDPTSNQLACNSRWVERYKIFRSREHKQYHFKTNKLWNYQIRVWSSETKQ